MASNCIIAENHSRVCAQVDIKELLRFSFPFNQFYLPHSSFRISFIILYKISLILTNSCDFSSNLTLFYFFYCFCMLHVLGIDKPHSVNDAGCDVVYKELKGIIAECILLLSV